MAEFNIPTLSEETVRDLESEGFMPVVRWKRPKKSDRLYTTQEAFDVLTREKARQKMPRRSTSALRQEPK